ncbi:MAG: thioredoxin domain-containing protein [Anaerolineales bacterium]
MPNHLAEENSPYLLQHADNPVNWYPWNAEALEKARSEDKPIFLSIGYAACHWCHVMAHESFEDPQTAAFMNNHFINIKVDREERPDLDEIYMNAVVAMTGQGGWPMSVFLTPQGIPFYGGTYFPPIRRYNMPSFREILQVIAQTWKNDRQRLLTAGNQVLDHLHGTNQVGTPGQLLNQDVLDQAALRLAQTYDWQHGGWGRAPKFPQPMAIEYLLRRTVKGDHMASDIAMHALRAMARGGMYDIVAGGFARYSTDDDWLIPHFEKMLYDNAQLALAYLHAYLLSADDQFRRITEETLDFMLDEMPVYKKDEPDKLIGFMSSLDADSEGEEGKYYIWTLAEIQEALDAKLAGLVIEAFGIRQSGNFEGANVLQRVKDDESLAQYFDQSVDEIQNQLKQALSVLREVRKTRLPPGKDDKILISWNALAVIALAEAARYLDRSDYLEDARSIANFLLAEMHPQDRLLRSWRAGNARHNAYLEDYAALILALLSLYQSDPHPHWFQSALQLNEEMLANYSDPDGGFFDTRADQGDLILRPKGFQDNATPSGNALATMALIQLATYQGNEEWRSLAEKMISGVQEAAGQYPTGFSYWLCATDAFFTPFQEVAILGDPHHSQTSALIHQLWSHYRPHTLAAISPFPPASGSPALLNQRPLLNHKPTAYVCQNFACKMPVTDPKDFAAQLNANPHSNSNVTGQ